MSLILLTVYVLLPLVAAQYAPLSQDFGMPRECIARPGDILLGYITTVREENHASGGRCEDAIHYGTMLPQVETFAYAVRMVNSLSSLLPNISLGYVVLDACWTYTPLGSMGRAPHFVGLQTNITDPVCRDGVGYYKTAILIGPHTSSESVLVGSMMSFYQIPTISTTASSDELSDDARFSYFLRVVPPDRFQADAMLDFLDFFNWTYISLVYSNDNYGKNGAKYAKEGMMKRGRGCIATSLGVELSATKEDYQGVIEKLLTYANARVVILFTHSTMANKMFAELWAMGKSDSFVFIGSDSVIISDVELVPPGSFSIDFSADQFPPFDAYYKSLNPENGSSKLWTQFEVERMYKCSYRAENSSESCSTYDSAPFLNVSISPYVYKPIDAVLAASHALHNLIRGKCPAAFQDKTLLDTCLTGPDILAQALKVNFQGVTGKIQFDRHGDKIGQYNIKQFNSARKKWLPFVSWLYRSGLTWLTEPFPDGATVPESICSRPCAPNEFAIRQDLCCWDCKKCRSYEVPDVNGTSCTECPAYKWPDEETETLCLPIPTTYIQWSQPLALALLSLTLLGILKCLFFIYMWILHRNRKLIKASSKEVSGIILIGILLAFFNVIVFLLKPTPVSCYLQLVLFHCSVTIIYAALLVKTNRVFRIFSAGRRGVRKPRGINIEIQLALIVILICVQIVLIAVSMLIVPPSVRLHMPIPTDKYVELACHQAQQGFLIPLIFNLVILLACAVHGFLIRKLPDNFNESWYIFVSVSTTLFIWVVFLPSYASTFYAYYQVGLLSLCLILNGFITMVTLYLPKIYAIYFIEENKLQFATFNSTMSSVQSQQFAPAISTIHSSRVAPSEPSQ